MSPVARPDVSSSTVMIDSGAGARCEIELRAS